MAGDEGTLRSQVRFKTVFVACAGVLATVALVAGLLRTKVALSLTAASVLLAVALDQLVALLMRFRVRRWLAIAGVVVLLLGAAFAVGELVVPPMISQGRAFIEHLPGLVNKISESRAYVFFDTRMHLGGQMKDLHPSSLLQHSLTPLLGVVSNIVSFLGALITVAFLTVFMMVFGGQLVDSIVEEARIERKRRYRDVLHHIYLSIGGYLRGLFFICTINATLTSTFLAISRMPYFLPLGVLSGFSSMVPYAGPAVAGTTISILALLSGGIWHGLATAIYFSVYGALEGNVLSPLVFRRTIHLNPLVTMLSVLFVGELAGVLGAIIAVPAVATVQIIVRELLAIRRDRLRSDGTLVTQ